MSLFFAEVLDLNNEATILPGKLGISIDYVFDTWSLSSI